MTVSLTGGCGPHCVLKDQAARHCDRCHEEAKTPMSERPAHGHRAVVPRTFRVLPFTLDESEVRIANDFTAAERDVLGRFGLREGADLDA